MRKVEAHQLLGLPKGAPPEEVERRRATLLAWLGSDAIPQELRPWAAAQRALVDEVYEYAALAVEEAASEDEEERQGQAPSGEKAEPGPPGRSFLGRLSARPVGMVAVGLLLGLAVLGVLWWRADFFRAGVAQTTQNQEEGLDPQQYLAAHRGRLAELERTVAANPQDAAALFELGETYMIGEDWQNAIDWFQRLLVVEPANVHALVDIGTASMNLGKYSEAEAALAKALTKDPENAQAHYNLGFLLAFRQDAPRVPEAVEHWQAVVRLAPGTNLAQVAQVHLSQFE
ncbi:MAG: tetratricopeptide repeat protein [Chloroflexi bacterium]|nr:tetratricopeptide repeat protein [Chloroflexota bacterium]